MFTVLGLINLVVLKHVTFKFQPSHCKIRLLVIIVCVTCSFRATPPLGPVRNEMPGTL